MNRFDIEMAGKWEGDIGMLTEDLAFYNGKKQHRVWTITKLPDGSYEGIAGDVIDKATGKTSGSAMRWNYIMDVPVDDTTYRLCAESLASENASRLAAMQRAKKNIDDLLEGLKQSSHTLRQSSIDEELFDVIAGYVLTTEEKNKGKYAHQSLF